MPRGSRYGRCGGCGASVLRLVHAVTGRLNLLEMEPHPQGTFRVQMLDERILAGTCTTAQDDGSDAGRLHRSHFAACPAERRRTRRQALVDVERPEVLVDVSERCCAACGHPLHEDLFGPGMAAIYAELHPLCIPDERVAEVRAPAAAVVA